VGGSLGQIALDSIGANVPANAAKNTAAIASPTESSHPTRPPATATVLQLERAIRAARDTKNKE
jgi:hypothetical protein